MNRFNAVRKLADKIVVTKKLSPPINPLKIIQDYGFEIEYKGNQYGIEAYSTLTDKPKITLNSEVTFQPRINFTLAHELGHIMIPWHNGDTKCDINNTSYKINGVRYIDTQELEANIFASELLMPVDWLKTKLRNMNENDLMNCIKNISNDAKTSIMACFYALEHVLASGHLLYVRRKNIDDYWHIFKTQGTFSNALSYDSDRNEYLLKRFALAYTTFELNSYEAIHYRFSPCPESTAIVALYQELRGDVAELLNIISGYNCGSILFSLSFILENLPEKYIFCLIKDDDEIVHIINSKDCILKIYLKSFDYIKRMLKKNNINTNLIQVDKEFSLAIIKDPMFPIDKTEKTDPNKLLKQIIIDVEGTLNKVALYRINGIVSAINSNNKSATVDELYQMFMGRLILEKDLSDYISHNKFKTYLLNKALNMRKS